MLHLDPSKKSCRYYCCCFCCCKTETPKTENNHTRPTELPEPRSQVETFDVTAGYRRKSKASNASATATSFMTFALNNERPSELDKNLVITNSPESPTPCYVRLDGAQEAATGLRRLSERQHKTFDIPEEATRL